MRMFESTISSDIFILYRMLKLGDKILKILTANVPESSSQRWLIKKFATGSSLIKLWLIKKLAADSSLVVNTEVHSNGITIKGKKPWLINNVISSTSDPQDVEKRSIIKVMK